MSLANKGSPVPKKKRFGKGRIPLHLRRIRAELKILDRATQAVKEQRQVRVLMNDLSSTGCGMFCIGPLKAGEMIEILFETAAGPLSIRGIVAWCQENMIRSKVFSEQTQFSHRIGIEFKFKDAEEQRTVTKLYENYAVEVLFGARAA